MVGPSWVGDMIMAQSLFMAIKRRDPANRIHVLAPAWTRPILQRMPEVEASVEMPAGHGKLDLAGRRRLGKRLANTGYHQAILLPNSWKSALTPFWAKIPKRTGWVGELRYGLLNDIRKLDKRRLPMTVQRFVALAHSADDPGVPDCPTPRLSIDPEQRRQTVQEFDLTEQAGQSILALCPGAEFGPSKRWPADAFGRLAARAAGIGWNVWLFGSGKDQAVCAEVNGASGGVCLDLSGRTELGQAVDLMSLAHRVVSNDSGLMHLAAALDRPLVALYGSTDPGHTPPLSKSSQVLTLNLDCAPCFKRECPLGHNDCMKKLQVDRVFDALDVEAV